jgi:hypothetical protein
MEQFSPATGPSMDEAPLLASMNRCKTATAQNQSKQSLSVRNESMCTYDMTSNTDAVKLATDAGAMGRTIAHAGVFATRSDQVALLARRECERALRTQSDLTNNPDAYRRTFIEAFITAYFDELVFLRNHMKLV